MVTQLTSAGLAHIKILSHIILVNLMHKLLANKQEAKHGFSHTWSSHYIPDYHTWIKV